MPDESAKDSSPKPDDPADGPANGRRPDPQGGRVNPLTTKVNVFEGEALRDHKTSVQRKLRRSMTQSEYLRYRLIQGGEPLTVNYPPPVIDRRREKRGTVPRSQRKKTE